jgi:chromosome segregation ATPase
MTANEMTAILKLIDIADGLKKENDVLKDEYKTITEENFILQSERESIENENKDLLAEIKALKIKKEKKTASESISTAAFTAMQNRVTELSDKIAALLAEKRGIEAENNELKVNIMNKGNETDNLKGEISKLKEALAHKNNEQEGRIIIKDGALAFVDKSIETANESNKQRKKIFRGKRIIK